MSLVYEALRKAEREKERKTGPAPMTPAAAPAPPVKTGVATTDPAPTIPKSSSRNYVSFLIVSLSAVGVAALAYVLVVATRNIPLSTDSVPEPRSTTAIPRATPTEPTPRNESPLPAIATENDPRFKLTGIMKMGDSYAAVINGRVIYQDNYVDGAVVKKVERDRVTLDLNGRETVLRLF